MGLLWVFGNLSDSVLRLPFESTELSSERWRSDGTVLLGSGKTKGSRKAKRYDKAGNRYFLPDFTLPTLKRVGRASKGT